MCQLTRILASNNVQNSSDYNIVSRHTYINTDSCAAYALARTPVATDLTIYIITLHTSVYRNLLTKIKRVIKLTFETVRYKSTCWTHTSWRLCLQ